jgi:hypothetical protein
MPTQEAKDGALRFPDFGKVAAAASGVALVLSVLYDYCFLTAMGLSLAEVPTTIADHVRSAIIWAPFVLGTMLGGAAWGAFLSWAPGVAAKPPADAPRHVRWLDAAYRFSYLYAFPASLVIASLSFTKFIFVVTLLLTVWVVGGPNVLNKLERRLNFSIGVWIGCYALPVIAMLVCLVGHVQGTRLREGTGNGWVLTVKDTAGTKTILSMGIRRFSESVVLLEPDRRVRVLPASEVVSASTTDAVPHATRAFCEYLNVLCTPFTAENLGK